MTTEPIGKIEFKTTKESCQSVIDRDGYVCPSCGGKPEPIETVDNSDNPTYWAGCNICNHFTWGVPKICYDIAVKMVVDGHYTHYSHLGSKPMEKDRDEKYVYWIRSQLTGTSEHVASILRHYSQITGNKITDF